MSDFAEFPFLSDTGAHGKTPIFNFKSIPVPGAGIFDAPSVNVCLNSAWASIVIGRLAVLTRPDAWIGTEEEKIAAASQMMEFLANMDCEDCSQFITDIETGSDGTLRVKRGGTWQNAAGSGAGDTTVINSQTTLTQQMYPPAPPDTGITAAARACNMASGLENWLFDKFEEVLVAVEATSDVIAAADSIFAVFPPVYLVADQSTDVVDEVVEATTNTLRAQYTTSIRDAITCAIYLLLKPTGTLQLAQVPGLKQAIEDATTTVPLKTAMIEFLELIEDAAFPHRATLYQSVGSAIDCELLCPPTWQVTFDFTIDDYNEDWLLRTGDNYGEYVPGVGWRSVLTGTTQRTLQLHAVPAADITEIEWKLSEWTPGLAVCSLLNNLNEWTGGQALLQTGTLDTNTNIWSGGGSSVTPFIIARPGCNTAAVDPGGVAVLQQVVIRGTGSYPYVHPPD